ncbi:hypothetical protein HPB50_027413 [Hyalomma asiaticum]|uniref:Uncharacterized protein n=1 Tax=Hyalomma asiaticum TaxID=266040 RepID=A0ACB7T4Z9_HYAAI|nr:hypothetical protein HPB50_027413 [Hyalomma asiaticum]
MEFRFLYESARPARCGDCPEPPRLAPPSPGVSKHILSSSASSMAGGHFVLTGAYRLGSHPQCTYLCHQRHGLGHCCGVRRPASIAVASAVARRSAGKKARIGLDGGSSHLGSRAARGENGHQEPEEVDDFLAKIANSLLRFFADSGATLQPRLARGKLVRTRGLSWVRAPATKEPRAAVRRSQEQEETAMIHPEMSRGAGSYFERGHHRPDGMPDIGERGNLTGDGWAGHGPA